MVYIKLPTYSNFFNIAISPRDTEVTLCYIVDKEETITLSSVSDFTYLPFLLGHLYIMYRGDSRKERVTYFQSEKNMWEHVKTNIGTNKGRFFQHEYQVNKDWIPHLTPTIFFPEFSWVPQFPQTIFDCDFSKAYGKTNSVPKLRGGSKKPKVLLIDDERSEKVLTVLRSLGMILFQ